MVQVRVGACEPGDVEAALNVDDEDGHLVRFGYDGRDDFVDEREVAACDGDGGRFGGLEVAGGYFIEFGYMCDFDSFGDFIWINGSA